MKIIKSLKARHGLAIAIISMAAIGVVSSARATPVVTPAGLNPGDTYRLAFLANSGIAPTSSNIADYNNLVTTRANLQADLAGLGATWRAIVSTATVDARDNTGTNPFSTGVAIYALDGVTKIADNNADLWNGSIDNSINIFGNGSSSGGAFAWTGTLSDGTAHATLYLGNGTGSASYGYSTSSNSQWVVRGATTDQPLRLYALSSILTVPGAAPSNIELFNAEIQSPGGLVNPFGTTLTIPFTFDASNRIDVLTVGTGGSLTNEGTMINEGVMNDTGSGSIVNNGQFQNKRSINVSSQSTFENATDATFDNDAVVVVRSTADFINNGTFNNNDRLTLLTDSGQTSIFTNNATFNNVDGARVTIGEEAMFNGTGTYTQTGGSLVNDGEMHQSFINIMGGTLSGHGEYFGTMFIADGVVVAPGNSPGPLTVHGDLTIEDGAVLQLEAGDTINVVDGGVLTIAAGAVIEFILSDDPGDIPNFEILIEDFLTAAGGIVFEDPGVGEDPVLFRVISDAFVAGTEFTVTASGELLASPGLEPGASASTLNIVQLETVPEPGTLAVFGFGLVGLAMMRRRRWVA